MKITLSISTVAVLLLSISVINGQRFTSVVNLAGARGTEVKLQTALKTVGLTDVKCSPGYLGLDCIVRGADFVSKLSCLLKGKQPGAKRGGISISEQQGAQQAQDMEVQNIESDNPHEKIRAPMVEVESYHRLIEAIPSLETDFFRSPIHEKERKEIIYECPKFLKMKYTPPPLNKAATPAVFKSNAALCGIQMALANMTRLIEEYVRIKNLQVNELTSRHLKRFQQQEVEETREVPFVRASRLRLARHLQRRNPLMMPPKYCQQRSDNTIQRGKTRALIRATNAHPRRKTTRYVLSRLGQTHRQQVGQKHCQERIQHSAQESEFREAKGFDEKKFIKFFGRKAKSDINTRSQNCNQLWFSTHFSFASLQTEDKQGSQQRNHQRSRSSFSKEGNKTEAKTVINYGFLLTFLSHRYKRKINKEASNAITNEVAALLAKRAIKQVNSITPGFYGQLFTIPKKTEDLSLVLDLRKLKNYVEQRNFKMESLTSICRIIRRNNYMTNARNIFAFNGMKILSILSPTFWPLTESPYFYKSTTPSSELNSSLWNQSISIFGTRLKDQDGEVQHNPIAINYTFRNVNKFTHHKPESSTKQIEEPHTRSQQAIKSRQDNAQNFGKLYWKRTSNVENHSFWLHDVEKTPGIKEHLFKEIEIMGCNTYHSYQKLQNKNFYRCQQHSMGIVVGFQTYSSLLPPSIYIWANYNTSIRPKIWGNDLSQITRSFRKIVFALHKNKHTPLDEVYTNVYQSCQCTIEADSSNGMVSINKYFKKLNKIFGPFDVNLFATRQNKKLSKYYSWYQDSQSSPVKYNTTDPTEGSTGKDNYDNNYANVEVCNFVSNSGKNQNSRAHTNTGVGDFARPKKRQIVMAQ
ncbi:hypothetical protein BB561_006765 [Smittium simulii]|uniref:Uncharacterized protein n=1 Tax=Smittium simulii TaxID=133385 RepID=A0A2T9Y1Q3_9FUNG|nr:hypothetical protein BB561_006765 [Smittium simulii]